MLPAQRLVANFRKAEQAGSCFKGASAVKRSACGSAMMALLRRKVVVHESS
jgi:hypothetical protein